MSTTEARQGQEQSIGTEADVWQGAGRVALAMDIVPALTAMHTPVKDESGRPAGYGHAQGPVLTDEERLSIVAEAAFFYRRGEKGLGKDSTGEIIQRYNKLTADMTERSGANVHFLIDAALALMHPDQNVGKAFEAEHFADKSKTNGN